MGMGLAIEGHVTRKYGKIESRGVGLKWALVARSAAGALALDSATKKLGWIPLPKRPRPLRFGRLGQDVLSMNEGPTLVAPSGCS